MIILTLCSFLKDDSADESITQTMKTEYLIRNLTKRNRPFGIL